MNELTSMLSLMVADAWSAIVLGLMLLMALNTAFKSDFAEAASRMGMLMINPGF
jgi:hypothetical protein